jgi:hypothetical protein
MILLGHFLFAVEGSQFWPQFRDAFLKAHLQLTLAGMEAAQTCDFQRYHYKGIGLY